MSYYRHIDTFPARADVLSGRSLGGQEEELAFFPRGSGDPYVYGDTFDIDTFSPHEEDIVVGGETLEDQGDIVPDRREAATYELRRRAGKGTDILRQVTDSTENWWIKTQKRSGTVFGSVRNLMNGIVSAGILNLPEMFALVGVFGGLGVLAMIALITMFSYELMIKQSSMGKGVYQYSNLMEKAYPGMGAIVTNLTVFIGGFGTTIAYFVLIGQSLSVSLQGWGYDEFWSQSEFWIILMAVVVAASVALISNIAIFEYTSWYSTIHFISFSFAVFVYFWTDRYDKLPPLDFVWLRLDANLASALAKAAFTYQSHTLLLPIYRHLEVRRPGVMLNITRASVLTASWMYFSVGLYGYLIFGSGTTSNILNNFPQSAQFFNFIRASYTMEVTLTLPISVTAYIIHVQAVLYTLKKRYPSAIPFQVKTETGGFTRVLVSIIFIAVAAALAIVVVDNDRAFGRVVTITGSISSSLLVFVFPQISYLRNNTSPTLTRTKLIAGIITGLGVVVPVASLYILFDDIAKNGF